MITAIANYLAKLESRSLRFQAATVSPEHTWLNHALIVVILGGGIGAVLGFLLVTPAFGFRVGLLIALLAYLYREVGQWRGRRDKPADWAWDATLVVSALYVPLRPVE